MSTPYDVGDIVHGPQGPMTTSQRKKFARQIGLPSGIRSQRLRYLASAPPAHALPDPKRPPRFAHPERKASPVICQQVASDPRTAPPPTRMDLLHFRDNRSKRQVYLHDQEPKRTTVKSTRKEGQRHVSTKEAHRAQTCPSCHYGLWHPPLI